MCTAITYKTKNVYFGRTLDLEYSYNEVVTVVPRNFDFKFKKTNEISRHYAIIGTAHIACDYPLFYDAINEKGLGIAALNFPQNAHYKEINDNLINLTSYEIIPWILATCSDCKEAISKFKKINISKGNFSEKYPATPLHWIISDNSNKSYVIEQTEQGLNIYENLIGVLANNPPFNYQMHNLNNLINFSNIEPESRKICDHELNSYSRGMGALGLPGDNSSGSRFLRISFFKNYSFCSDDEEESVGQFFHLLDNVKQIRGSVKIGNEYVKTVYTNCYNLQKGIYYFKTYSNSRISVVNMFNENLESSSLFNYRMKSQQDFKILN